jgi:transposase
LVPGVYFRALPIGYFEGIDSERGIAWRLADSLALRQFVRIGITESTPDHATVSRTRRLIDLETHGEVFGWVLGLLADRGLLKGKRVGVDATTLEAVAAMRDTKASRPEKQPRRAAIGPTSSSVKRRPQPNAGNPPIRPDAGLWSGPTPG